VKLMKADALCASGGGEPDWNGNKPEGQKKPFQVAVGKESS
jgi:hypothetical protein